MSDFFERFVADLTKGAAETEGFVRGGRVGVEVAREPQGHEQKLAAAIPPPIPRAAIAKKGPPPIPSKKAPVGAASMFTIGGKTPEWTKGGSVSGSYARGAEAALDAFGVKEAFWGAILPTAASFLGGAGLKKGLGWAASKFLPGAKGVGGAVGNVARKGLNVLNKGGLGADAMNMGANMVAGEAANRVFNG